MSTLIKFITAFILSLTLCSCQFGFIGTGEKGNGNVVTEDRNIEGSFNAIEASEGLDVIVHQDNELRVSVEADENLQDLIITEIKGNTLKVHCEKAIGWASAKKVFVSMPDVAKLESNSGAELWSTGVIKASTLHLRTSSGADIRVEVESDDIVLESSSGSDLDVRGMTTNLTAHASSGSDIDASGLTALNAKAEASSGADIKVNATDKIDVRTNSGGDVHYIGNPAIVQKKGSTPEKIFKD
ncbi:head GIN domain-containing protein [Robertkochia sediminum]|uniref:head GIN domain-containing protein n=1 Tax=Robertkochia sediminum TaxID=2785326 RepID=UPI0019338EE7|nr:head GIN domain-containing protein [Robertkochia sediminum]MBL7473663.1 DUF2807 domain-containing protein [Robertkochia sediminum]